MPYLHNSIIPEMTIWPHSWVITVCQALCSLEWVSSLHLLCSLQTCQRIWMDRFIGSQNCWYQIFLPWCSEPAGSKFPRREKALGGNLQARTPTNNATSRLGCRAQKSRSLWGILVQEAFHPQLTSTDMSDKHRLLFQTINNIQKMKQVMITTV
jgi:hypothetical protein